MTPECPFLTDKTEIEITGDSLLLMGFFAPTQDLLRLRMLLTCKDLSPFDLLNT